MASGPRAPTHAQFLLLKVRMFVSCLPVVFRAGFDETNIWLRPQMKMFFSLAGSSIIGEGADRIGRGGRRIIFAVDSCCQGGNVAETGSG